jgi:hypothetical protein
VLEPLENPENLVQQLRERARIVQQVGDATAPVAEQVAPPVHGGRLGRPITRTQGAIVIAAILMAGLSAIGGAAEELRIYVPAITVTMVAGAAS